MGASVAAAASVVHEDIPVRQRLIVALDVPTREDALAVIGELGDSIVFYKIGLQLQFAGGLGLAEELIAGGKRVFLDSKLFDIAQTVRGATENIAKMGVDFLTVHGDGPTIRAAIEGRGDNKLKILAVTVLTSLDANDIADMGYAGSVRELALQRAPGAWEAGCDGVIASGEEAAEIRRMAGGGLLIVTPGIRSGGVPHHDQKRVVTPKMAIADGADYLVVGRQILKAGDKKAMAQQILDEIASAL